MNLIKKIKKVKRVFSTVLAIERKLDELRYLQGCIACNQLKSMGGVETLHEFQCFSQWGEDGIIQWLINNIDISRKVFIEFGTQDYKESNTRFLLMHDNWSGLIIDGDRRNIEKVKNEDIYWRYNLKAISKFVTAENINRIFEENGLQREIGLLSVDIDGNDYWVWKAINIVQPDIVICEYNHRFGMERAVSVPYDPNFVRQEKHYSCIYYGASIRALTLLAGAKGYSLVAGNSNGNNVFYVKNELLNDIVKRKEIEDVFSAGKFRECRDEKGKLVFFDSEQEQAVLKNLPLVDVSGDY